MKIKGKVTVITILLMALLWLVPMKNQTVSVQFFTDGSVEGKTVAIYVCSKEAYENVCEQEAIVSEGTITVPIYSEYIPVHEVYVVDAEFKEAVTGMKVISSGYWTSTVISASYDGMIFDETNNGHFALKEEAAKTIEDGIDNTKVLRIIFSGLVVMLYLTFLIYHFLKKYFGIVQAIGVVVVGWGAVFLLNTFLRKGLLRYSINIGGMAVSNTILVGLLLAIFAVLLMVCILWEKENKWSKWILVGIYLFALVFSIGKMIFYNEKVANTPDEKAHISYVAYLEENHEIIPRFENMQMMNILYSDSEIMQFQFEEGTTNYLLHPPLYYHVMQLANGITVNADETYTANLDRLRMFSMGIVTVALMLIFYIGYTRMKKIPLLHLLFAMICISVPMLTYGASGVSNDSLAMLTVSIFFFGIIRYIEKKRNFLTYILIAVGISATVLTKLTAGLLVAIAAIIVLVSTLLHEKNWKELLSWKFLVTISVYIIPIIYYLYIYTRYGAFQISLYSLNAEYGRGTEYYVNVQNRTIMGLLEYTDYYYKQFMGTWTDIASHVSLHKPSNSAFLEKIALELILFIPLCLLVKPIREKMKYKQGIIGGYIAVVVTGMLQFYNAYSGFGERGYLGGFQSRYYLCIIVVFAFCAALLVQEALQAIKAQNKYAIAMKHIIVYVTVAFIGLLAYEDFIYFLLYFRNYLS